MFQPVKIITAKSEDLNLQLTFIKELCYHILILPRDGIISHSKLIRSSGLRFDVGAVVQVALVG